MILNFSLFSLAAAASAILGVCANPHGAHLNRHQGIAKRAAGNVQLHKRFGGARWTYYDVGLGACGQYNVATDFIVALNTPQFGSGYPGPNCFKTITMSYGGKTTTATIMDECPGCPYGGLDLSRGLFQFFAPESVGVIYAEWYFGSGGGGDNPPATTEAKPTSTWQPPPTTTWKPEPTTTWTPEPTTTWKPEPTTTWKPEPTTTWKPEPTTTWSPPAAPTTTWTPLAEVKPTTTWKPDPTTTSTWKPDPTTPTTTPATTEKTSTVQSSSASVSSSSASHSSASHSSASSSSASQALASASSSSKSASSSAPSPTGTNIDNFDEILTLFGSVILAAAEAGSDGSAAADPNSTVPETN